MGFLRDGSMNIDPDGDFILADSFYALRDERDELDREITELRLEVKALKAEALKRGEAELFLDGEHNPQWRWKTRTEETGKP
jgi:hypothetical protein